MTKNTTRRKKRKNLKLRRTIRKTVAAIIMIMAVVVAAIPVENFGTMQAQTSSGSDISMEALYKAYQADMCNTDEEDVIFNGVLSDITDYDAGWDEDTNTYLYDESICDYKTIRIVPGENGEATTLNWEFLVNNRNGKTQGTDAVIVGYNRKDIKDDIKVTERLYTDYFLVESKYIEAVREILKNETYKVQFVEDTTQTSCTVPEVDADHPSFTITLKKITTNVSEQGSTYGSKTETNYSIAGSRNEYSAVNVFKVFTELYKTKCDAIAVYNSNLTNLITTVNENQTTMTKETYEKIESDYNELAKKNTEYLEVIEFNYSNITNTEGLEKFCIKNRFSFMDNGYSYSLNGFELETYVDGNGNKGYIPRWKNQKGGATYQEDLKIFDGDANRSNYLDPNGYIQLESITVSGIGNGAFKDFEDFKSITFPETIEFIGNDAFSGCLGLISINLTNIEAVGNRAFKGCTNLSTVTFTSEDETTAEVAALGAEAFYGTKLSNVIFPKTIKSIGYGCFATSQLVSFEIPGGIETITIWPFAFYNCSKLTKTSFPDETFSEDIIIGLGAFAVSSGGEMSEFTFPNSMTDIIQSASIGKKFNLDDALTEVGEADITTETYFDYILAGRSGLKNVVFSYRLGKSKEAKVPDNTLQGCSNLNTVVFGAKCLNETNGYTTYDPEMLFRDVENQNFYVEGPGYLNQSTTSTKSTPREKTASAKTASSSYSVPYIFLTSTSPDVTRIEMSTGANDDCLAILEDIDGNADTKEVRLTKYTYNGTENIPDLIISSMIGPYKLTQLGEGCFKEVKDAVLELIIEDGSVSIIEADAFNGSKTLQKVTIGNSVKTIGDGAFANCSKLENVYFSSPKAVNSINENSLDSEWASVLTIGENAFKTTSDYLTFHGDIHSGYAPFELAMSGESFGSSAGTRTICYKTDAPQNLTVVYDHQYGLSTLIDYPHYEEIDSVNAELVESVAPSRNTTGAKYSIKDNFEAYNGWKTVSDYTAASPTPEEGAVIAATYDIELPTGIQSIDAKTYISYSNNSDNLDYLYLTYTEDEQSGVYTCNTVKRVLNGSHDIKKLYSDNNEGSDVTSAGLFSGYFYEVGTGIVPDASTEKTFNGRTMREEERTSGNDQLLEISLNTVESLPDYAFESCENLNSVGFGAELLTLGNAPFRNCESLTNVETSNNTYFTCENGIIYRTSAGGSSSDLGTGYVIEECLMPRGNLIGFKAVNSTTDSLLSKVSGIKPEAFSYCPDLSTVDLSDTSITVIPEGCFKGDSTLQEVVLPESVSRIDSKAFSDTRAKVTIYSTTCQIESDAFDDGNGTIRGYMYSDGSESKYSTAYQYAKNHNIQFEEITAQYTLRFLDYDGTLIETQQVEQGKDGVAPNWTPTRTGYDFKEWSWEKETGNSDSVVTGEKAYRNVTENRIILATYTVGSGIVSDGKDYTLTISGGKNIGGQTTATLKGGTAVSIIADTKSGSSFQYWSESTGKYAELFENIHTDVTTFIMPNADVTITANYTDGSSGSSSDSSSGSNSGSNSGSGSSSTESETKYTLTVNYGSGSGEYKAGEVVSISAYAPESSSKVFSKWTSTTTGVGFASATSATTTITMPASAVTVTANYKTRTADDEEDDDELEALNNRKGTSTTATVTTGTNNATVTTTTGTVTNTTSSSTSTTTGDSIAISKDGISNANVASTNVEGASDNFVVKVSDSGDAVTAAEEALKNKYGSLDGILYFPMDITLYDVTGKNKITDTTGLNVTVTIPIPDELIQYGGNVRVAAIENGQLQDLNVKFTTIDGISCMSFVPPHFSPYVIYVDTNNLVAGQMLDATPKTGDPVHPKWFLAIGMACLSVILFTTGDKKKKIKMA